MVVAPVTWLLVCATLVAQPAAKPKVVIETSLGNITVELDAKSAPVTTKNFLRYVEAGRYEYGRFHRTVTLRNQPDKKVKIEVIQGGVGEVFETSDFAPIPLERTNKTGLRHRNGTISMARNGADTATSDFFICIGDQPELDFGGKRNPDGQGFAAFGRVLSGMDVVRRIQKCPAKDQTLTPPITIKNIRKASLSGGQFIACPPSTPSQPSGVEGPRPTSGPPARVRQ